MKQRWFALLLLLFCSFALLAFYIHKHVATVIRTYQFTAEEFDGWQMSSGFEIDVFCCEKLPNGGNVCKIVAESLWVHERIEEHGTLQEKISLGVTSSQAEILDQAQQRGNLIYSVCRPEKSFNEKIRKFFFGPRIITYTDVVKQAGN